MQYLWLAFDALMNVPRFTTFDQDAVWSTALMGQRVPYYNMTGDSDHRFGLPWDQISLPWPFTPQENDINQKTGWFRFG